MVILRARILVSNATLVVAICLSVSDNARASAEDDPVLFMGILGVIRAATILFPGMRKVGSDRICASYGLKQKANEPGAARMRRSSNFCTARQSLGTGNFNSAFEMISSPRPIEAGRSSEFRGWPRIFSKRTLRFLSENPVVRRFDSRASMSCFLLNA